jgi:predicted nuclease of predicted toxin-antitoxin system
LKKQCGGEPIPVSIPHSGNRTPDTDILQLARRDARIIISKDSDFVTAHLLRGEPEKLLLISTGNTSNIVKARLPCQTSSV